MNHGMGATGKSSDSSSRCSSMLQRRTSDCDTHHRHEFLGHCCGCSLFGRRYKEVRMLKPSQTPVNHECGRVKESNPNKNEINFCDENGCWLKIIQLHIASRTSMKILRKLTRVSNQMWPTNSNDLTKKTKKALRAEVLCLAMKNHGPAPRSRLLVRIQKRIWKSVRSRGFLNWRYPKWMVYKGKSIYKWMIKGFLCISGNL